MVDQKNLLLAIIASVAIILAFQFFIEKPRIERRGAPTATEQAAGQPGAAAPDTVPSPGAPGVAAPGTGAAPAPQVVDVKAVLAESPRVQLKTPRLTGSVALAGGRIDDLTLTDYRETLDPDSPPIVLLKPKGLPDAYYAEFGWVAGKNGPPVPGPDTVWQADGTVLSPGRPVTLTWDNGAGLVFKRTIAVDDKYLFTVTQEVENRSDEPVTLYPYGLIARSGTPKISGFFILHEGPLGVFDGTLKEVDYKDLREDGAIEKTSTGGWIGITDKYWLVALAADQERPEKSRFAYFRNNGRDLYQADFVDTTGWTVAPGGKAAQTTRLFAGAKLVSVIEGYEEEYGIQRFDLAIDWGWFYFLTKPIFHLLDYINRHVGNFGVAILLLTVLIKALFFPLANRSYRAMSKMKKLQPEMTKIRERFKDDKQRMQQELMALYKKEKANPVSGCLPIFIQIPVFFSLYKVLFVTIEMRHAPFFGWVKDLSAPDPYTIFNLFGLIPWQPPEFLMIGAWPLIMGLTMYLQQRLNPQPPDPVQAKVFMILPFVFTIMLARFPVGLVIYWAWNNILSIAQQWVIMRRMGVT